LRVSGERWSAGWVAPPDRFQIIRKARHGVFGDERVVVQAEKVLAVGGPQADVQGFGEAKILGQAHGAHGGKFRVHLSAAIAGAVVDHDDLVRSAQQFQALPQCRFTVEGNDYNGDAGGFRGSDFGLRRQVVILL
jgi:hypothetical protein